MPAHNLGAIVCPGFQSSLIPNWLPWAQNRLHNHILWPGTFLFHDNVMIVFFVVEIPIIRVKCSDVLSTDS